MEPMKLSFIALLDDLNRAILGMKDPRLASNATKYSLSDAVLGAFSVFFMQMTKVNLLRANLEGTQLINANLREANLSEAKLINTDLRYAQFGGANLSKACLEAADLTKASFRGADVSRADLSGAILIEANFGSSEGFGSIHFDKTFFWKTILPDGSIVSEPCYQNFYDK